MITEFSGSVWRILFRDQADTPLAPARAPEGRFHHSGQVALYASLSAEGAGIAIRRYVAPGDPARVLQQYQILRARMMDVRGQSAASVVWQDQRAKGAPSSTWRFSDDARRKGLDGLLYSSRSRPELSHLVIFIEDPGLLHPIGSAVTWTPDWPSP